MSRQEELDRIRQEIEEAQKEYQRDKEWQAYYAALLSLCKPLNNTSMRTVLPKVVAVDSIYKANLIRYLQRPEKGEDDTRPALYHRLAEAIIALDLDSRFSVLQEHNSRLNTHCLAELVEIHKVVSQAARGIIGQDRDVFASKYLHFCQPDFFPILDGKAEDMASTILSRLDSEGEPVVLERFACDKAKGRYDWFCRAVLALQSALAGAGLGQYSLAELDRYLFLFGGRE